MENTLIDRKKKKINSYGQDATSEFATLGLSTPSFVTVPMLQNEERFFRAQPRMTTRKFTTAVLLRGSRTFYTRHWQFCKAKFISKTRNTT